jgi:ABC-type transport system involved in multi-copper enzyme maturation permease subunit
MTAAPAVLGSPRRSAPREFLAAVATIMVKELRSRMRGRRAFILLTIYLGLLALIAYGVYLITAPNVDNGFNGSANASALVGQAIFMTLSIFQLILICFIAPAATAGQISLEREKQTLDLLISTPMRPGAIVIGKLAAALAYVVLMIVAAVPITAIVLMYGGATVGDIVRQQVVLLAVALGLGAVGLFYSALLKRTQAATVLTYITVLALTLGTAAIFTFWTIFANQDNGGFGIVQGERAPEQLLYVNPGVAMLDVISNTESDPFGGLTRLLAEMRGDAIDLPLPPGNEGGAVECDELGCRPVDGVGVGAPAEVAGAATGYWWTRVSLTFVGLALILTFAAMRLVVPAGMRGNPLRRPRKPAVAGGPADLGTIDELTVDDAQGDER